MDDRRLDDGAAPGEAHGAARRRAIQVHGALGYSTDTPLAHMFQHARWARLADGADEVHQMQIAQRAIAAWKKDGKTHAATGGSADLRGDIAVQMRRRRATGGFGPASGETLPVDTARARPCSRYGRSRGERVRAAIADVERALRVVRAHLTEFLATVDAATAGKGLPGFVVSERRKFLRCGVLSHGFARVRCGAYAFERLVPFSCKAGAVRPSCGGRRMAERAAHLVDHESPADVPGRTGCATTSPTTTDAVARCLV